MSQNNPAILHAGLNVAKLSLQFHLAGGLYSLANDAKGHAHRLKLLRTHPGAHVICEATGSYEQPVVRVLQAVDIPVSVLAAVQVRYFARARVSAPKPIPLMPPSSPSMATPSNLRRRQLLHTRTMETNRADHYPDPLCVRQHRQFRKRLEKPIAQCDQLNPQPAAALAAVAPYTTAVFFDVFAVLPLVCDTAALRNSPPPRRPSRFPAGRRPGVDVGKIPKVPPPRRCALPPRCAAEDFASAETPRSNMAVGPRPAGHWR